MTTRATPPAALPRARQAWPLPYGHDVATRLDAWLPSEVDEDNEVLLAHLVSAPPRPASAA